jgi:hypothetical protein
MTIYFQDNFEDATLDAWTSLYEEGGSVSNQNTIKKSGNNALEILSVDWGANWIRKNLASTYTTVYTRFYIRFSALPTNGEVFGYIPRLLSSAGAELFTGHLNNAGGVYSWGVYTSGGDHDYTVSFSPVIDTWYCVELKCIIDSTVGAITLWINGSPIIAETGINTGTVAIGRLEFMNLHPGVETAFYIDDVIISDSYIGPESSYSPSTRSGLPNTMVSMLNSKMLFE